MEKHSHGLRQLAALEAARGSFDDTAEAIERATGVRLGKRQAEALAGRAAADVDDFYAQRRPQPAGAGREVLVLSADGKGIVMRPEALRPATAKAAASATTKLSTRLSKGEKRNRKRLAEVGAVYDADPVVRIPADILARGQDTKQDTDPEQPAQAPVAKNKWLTASVTDDAATVVVRIFDEADRRDPTHARTWIALVDGNNHQIDRIQAEATQRGIDVTILCDFIHVLEYLWKAALVLPPGGRPHRRGVGARQSDRRPAGQGHPSRRRPPPRCHPSRAGPSPARRCRRLRVSYLQLVHNEWDPAAKTTRAKVLYSFGRADQLDRPAIERLITALTRVLGTQPAAYGAGPDRARPVGLPGLMFTESRPLGGAWLLDGLWHRLGIDTLLRGLAAGTRRDAVVERVVFALVANRALAPSSKLAATSWIAHDVHLPGLTGGDYRVSDDACYRAMDWLISVQERLARGVFDAVAHLLNLEVDLIFFDYPANPRSAFALAA